VFACALPALIYKPFLDNPFVFDDRITVVLNPSLGDLSDVRGVLLHNLARPAVNISYAVDRAFWGVSSFGFHLTNGLLHIIVVGLLYGWCTRALADGVRPGSDRGQTRVGARSDPGLTPAVEWPAFFAAAAFGVHPVMGATTAYVSARSELLAALGVLAALMFARRAIVRSQTASWVIAAAFSLLAAASSASAAALPLLVLAYDAWVLRDKGWRRRTQRIYLPALVAIALLFAAWRLPGLFAADRVPARGLVDNLLTEAIVIWRYAALLAGWPGQALVHQVHWVTTSLDPAGLMAFASLALTVTTAVYFRESRPLVAFGVVWFVAVLAPSSSLVPLRDAMAEPRAYLASAGLFLAAASALAGPLASRRLVRAVALAAVVVLGIQTYQRNRLWSDPMKLWEESVQRSPDAWQARLGHADLLREIRRCDLAAPEYEAALALNPDEPGATAGLSSCR
jgi:hypothetical protein